MDIRYMGFEQLQNARSYRFDVVEKGKPSRRCTVTADLSLFHSHGVVIQEGPSLSAGKLVADLEKDFWGVHELTADDLLSYATARSAAQAKRAESRRSPRRAHPAVTDASPWRGTRH